MANIGDLDKNVPLYYLIEQGNTYRLATEVVGFLAYNQRYDDIRALTHIEYFRRPAESMLNNYDKDVLRKKFWKWVDNDIESYANIIGAFLEILSGQQLADFMKQVCSPKVEKEGS